MHRDRRNILREPLLQRFAAQAGEDQHSLASGVEGRLEVISLVADERRLARDRPVAGEGLAQHAGRRLAPRALVVVTAAQDQIDPGISGREHMFEGFVNRVKLFLRQDPARDRQGVLVDAREVTCGMMR